MAVPVVHTSRLSRYPEVLWAIAAASDVAATDAAVSPLTSWMPSGGTPMSAGPMSSDGISRIAPPSPRKPDAKPASYGTDGHGVHIGSTRQEEDR